MSLADDGNEPQFVGCVFVGNCVHPKSVTKVDAINALKSLSMVFLTIKDGESKYGQLKRSGELRQPKGKRGPH